MDMADFQFRHLSERDLSRNAMGLVRQTGEIIAQICVSAAALLGYGLRYPVAH